MGWLLWLLLFGKKDRELETLDRGGGPFKLAKGFRYELGGRVDPPTPVPMHFGAQGAGKLTLTGAATGATWRAVSDVQNDATVERGGVALALVRKGVTHRMLLDNVRSITAGVFGADLLALDSSAGMLFGPGWFLNLGWTGREWRWGSAFKSASTGDAMGTMRVREVPGERNYMFRWVPLERRWGRVA